MQATGDAARPHLTLGKRSVKVTNDVGKQCSMSIDQEVQTMDDDGSHV